MAEVLGALSSVITLLDVTVKGAKFIQGITEIQDDYQELCDEIAKINDMVQYAQTKNQPAPSSYPERLFAQSSERLRNIVEELKRIECDVHKTSANNGFKARKRHWIIKSGKIQKLLRRAEKTKKELHDAIQCQTMEQTMYMVKSADAMSDIHAMMREIMGRLIQNESAMFAQRRLQLPDLASNPANENKSRQIEELDDTAFDSDGDEAVDHQDASHQLDTHKSTTRDERGTGFQNNSSVASISVDIESRGHRCYDNCKCRCHGSRQHSQSPKWARWLLGQLDISYGPGSGPGEWDPRCKCSRERDLQAAYRVPMWLWAKAVVLSAQYSVGGLQCSLRSVRIVPWTDSFWRRLNQVDTMQAFLDGGNSIYYNDTMETGQEIFEYLIAAQHYESLNLLLEIWKNVIQMRGVSMRVVGAGARALNRKILSVNDANTVRKLLKFATDDGGAGEVNGARWRLHKAAYEGIDLQKLLSEYNQDANMDINEWDKMGWAPLHHASDMGQVDALQQLMDAGANMNVRDMAGQTPLMHAAANNSIECMQRLVAAHCRVNDRDDAGRTALHSAVEHCSVDGTRLLLREGALVTAKDLWGQTPLHSLAECHSGNAMAIEQIAGLLLAAPAIDPNARDTFGSTPIMRAVVQNNLALLRCLVNDGASTACMDNNSGNLLHCAASNCRAQCMEFLDSLSLSNIDTKLRDCYNMDSWELFVFCINASPYQLGEFRYPSVDDQRAFVTLYSGIRERNLKHNISALEQTADSVSRHDVQAAIDHLAALSEHKIGMHNSDEATYYQGLGKKLEFGDQDTVLRAIRSDIQELKEDLLDSSWDWYDSLFDPSDDTDSDEVESIQCYDEEEFEDGGGSEDENLSTEPNSDDLAFSRHFE